MTESSATAASSMVSVTGVGDGSAVQPAYDQKPASATGASRNARRDLERPLPSSPLLTDRIEHSKKIFQRPLFVERRLGGVGQTILLPLKRDIAGPIAGSTATDTCSRALPAIEPEANKARSAATPVSSNLFTYFSCSRPRSRDPEKATSASTSLSACAGASHNGLCAASDGSSVQAVYQMSVKL